MHAPVRTQDSGALKIFQSTALTGLLSGLGVALNLGAKVYFSALNAKSGVNGRAIELTAVDDAYEVPRAVTNVKGVIENRNCFAIFNCFGTPMVEAMLTQVIASGIPFFAPLTGALLAHPKNTRNVFNIRASYADETQSLVQHLTTVGIKRIAMRSAEQHLWQGRCQRGQQIHRQSKPSARNARACRCTPCQSWAQPPP